jgi:hypothetical protein
MSAPPPPPARPVPYTVVDPKLPARIRRLADAGETVPA